MGIIDSLVSPGSGVFGLLDDLVKRMWKDPAQQDAARLQLLEMQQQGAFKEFDGNLQLTLAQIATQTAQEKNPSVFVSGPRAFIEWVCGTGLAYQWCLRPFLEWGSTAWWHIPTPPALDTGTLFSLITALLGTGALHIANTVTAGKS